MYVVERKRAVFSLYISAWGEDPISAVMNSAPCVDQLLLSSLLFKFTYSIPFYSCASAQFLKFREDKSRSSANHKGNTGCGSASKPAFIRRMDANQFQDSLFSLIHLSPQACPGFSLSRSLSRRRQWLTTRRLDDLGSDLCVPLGGPDHRKISALQFSELPQDCPVCVVCGLKLRF